MTYGVIPQGFNRKPLPVILAELEAAMITEFGPRVIQTPQSPLGQINGLMADLVSDLWEFAEDVYQSYDPDQAEGSRLDTLAKLRLLRRATQESDFDFRQAITNQGEARVDIQDITRAIKAVPGVTYAKVFLNESQQTDSNRLEPGTICVAVLGGDESDLVTALRSYVVPGISTYGNTYVSTTIEGFCRTFAILRPILVPVTLTVNVKAFRDNLGCPPPSALAIANSLKTAFLTTHELINGDDITHFKVRSVIESLFPNVEVVSIVGTRPGPNQFPEPIIIIDFLELATVNDVTVNLL